MTGHTLASKLDARLAAVCDTPDGRDALDANQLDQTFVFALSDGPDLSVTLSAGEDSLAVATRDAADPPVDPGFADTGTPQYETTTIFCTTEQLEALLDGAFLSELYCEGEIEIRGLQPAWLLLGYLFGINHDLLRET
jgi:hypothetical protein